MARETGTLLECVAQARYHLLPGKGRLMAFAGATEDMLEKRNLLIDDHLKTIQAQLVRIKAAAETGDIETIKKVLAEQVGIGHNL